ncbi:MAG: DUF1501 domain-containing protein [Polyangiaceae bacterium]
MKTRLPILSRRQLLHGGAGGIASLLAARFLSHDAWAAAGAAAAASAKAPKAKACIVLWLNGGPSHIDTFDPKPGATTARFKAIKTRAPSIQLSEHLPLLAEQADKLAVINSMSSKEGNHDRARYFVHTGYSPNPTIQHPSLGGWVAEEVGSRSADLPNFVSIGGPSVGAGFLGKEFGPFIVQNASVPPQNVGFFHDVNDARFHDREGLLDDLEGKFYAQNHDPLVDGRRAVYDESMRMMHTPKLAAFDVSKETEATRAMYGDSDFGRGCLVARRLIENGVRVVEVVLDGWDTHTDNFGRTTKLMGTLDPAFSGLLKDLAQRKLLGSTLVACMGEFGRTPTINGNDGRDHYPQVWSAALAGGGIRGGVTYGKTDALGAKIVEKSTSVQNLMATMTTQLGLNPDKSVTSPIGRPISITDNGVAMKEIVA